MKELEAAVGDAMYETITQAAAVRSLSVLMQEHEELSGLSIILESIADKLDAVHSSLDAATLNHNRLQRVA